MAEHAMLSRDFINLDGDESPNQLPFPDEPIPGQYEIEFPDGFGFLTEAQAIAEGDAAFVRFEKGDITEEELDSFLAQLFGPASIEAAITVEEMLLAEQLGAISEGYMPNFAA